MDDRKKLGTDTLEDRKYYIYIHYRKDTSVCFYVGKGKGNRWRDTQSRNNHWNNIKRKHGFYAFKLLENLTEQEAYQLEEKYIAAFKALNIPLTNVDKGGSGRSNPGLTNGRADKNVYDFYKLEWEMKNGVKCFIKETCTVFELRQKYGLPWQQFSKLLRGDVRSVNRWCLSKDTALVLRKAVNKVYHFENLITSEKFKGTIKEFELFSGLSRFVIHKLVKKQGHVSQNWAQCH